MAPFLGAVQCCQWPKCLSRGGELVLSGAKMSARFGGSCAVGEDGGRKTVL